MSPDSQLGTVVVPDWVRAKKVFARHLAAVIIGMPRRPGTAISGYVYKSPLTTPEGPSAPIVGAVVTCTGGSATVEEDGSFSIELEGKIASGTPILVTAVAVDFEIATKNVTWSGDAPSVVFRLSPIGVYGNSGE